MYHVKNKFYTVYIERRTEGCESGGRDARYANLIAPYRVIIGSGRAMLCVQRTKSETADAPLRVIHLRGKSSGKRIPTPSGCISILWMVRARFDDLIRGGERVSEKI